MKIVHIATEFAPIAKAGGLGEVVTGLSRELTKLGHDVDVIIPKYDFIKLPSLSLEIADFKCLTFANSMWQTVQEECNLHLLEARHPSGYFHRGKIYACEDDIPRFIYFSRAALEYLKLKKEPIDVLHLHDWHVSLCAPLLKDIFKEIRVKKVILSIHNVEYQGKCAAHDLDQIGMQGQKYLTKQTMQDNNPKYPETINLLKGGIVYSDDVIAVSTSYAKEILTKEYGFLLEETLKKHKDKVHGIVNGIDETMWDPKKDPHIAVNYSIENFLDAKEKNKKILSISLKKTPLIGAITRLVPQKGIHLIEAAIEKAIELKASFILLGSSPIEEIQKHFDKLKIKYKNHTNIHLYYHYDEKLAHQLFAALDFLIVPSKYEPCGLTQLIAMRYATVPIVRATGGLKDTVFDCDDPNTFATKHNGFVFHEYSIESVNKTLERAVKVFREKKPLYETLQRRGMLSDFSWEKPTKNYLKIYQNTQSSKTTSIEEFIDAPKILKN